MVRENSLEEVRKRSFSGKRRKKAIQAKLIACTKALGWQVSMARRHVCLEQIK